jgi:hypothetical protein
LKNSARGGCAVSKGNENVRFCGWFDAEYFSGKKDKMD